MPAIGVRWSEHEAPKPYARPFMVSFLGDGGVPLGAVAVSGADLLYYRQFQAAVLALSGELFTDPAVEASGDPQRAWLDLLSGLLPPIATLTLRPSSSFDHEQGRIFWVEAAIPGLGDPVALDASAVLEYQDLQAALAHRSGGLYRNRGVEAVADPSDRHRAWLAELAGVLQRPAADEAMTVDWPWRPRPVP
jgi:hypothetical protein